MIGGEALPFSDARVKSLKAHNVDFFLLTIKVKPDFTLRGTYTMPLNVKYAAIALSIALIVPINSQAQDIDTCLTITNTTERLACFDDAHNTPNDIRFPQQADSNTSEGGQQAAPQSRLTAEERFGRTLAKIKSLTATSDKELEKIESEIEAAGFSKAGNVRVTLNNGQIWQQTNADDTKMIPSRLRRQSSVEIKRGALGSYIMKIKPWGRSMRVRRLR